MKKVIYTVSMLAVVCLSFLGGYQLSQTENTQRREESCNIMLSFAIDKIEHLAQDFQPEEMDAMLCNIYAAKEHTENAELSSALYELWNVLLFNREKLIGREMDLVEALKNQNVQLMNEIVSEMKAE